MTQFVMFLASVTTVQQNLFSMCTICLVGFCFSRLWLKCLSVWKGFWETFLWGFVTCVCCMHCVLWPFTFNGRHDGESWKHFLCVELMQIILLILQSYKTTVLDLIYFMIEYRLYLQVILHCSYYIMILPASTWTSRAEDNSWYLYLLE